jgi:CheY-like chemotaxis protein
MEILILDDMKERHEFFIDLLCNQLGLDAESIHCAYDYDTAVELIKDKEFDVMFLDHDLGESPGYNERVPDGNDFVNTLTGISKPKPKAIFVHSMNFPGATRMIRTLTQYEFAAYRFDLLNMNINILKNIMGVK